jgi:hypothetical protein
MVIVSDSYMGIFTPVDIESRIMQILEKKIVFPFIKKNDIIGKFYFF